MQKRDCSHIVGAMHKITAIPPHLWKNVRGRNRGYKEEPRRPAGQSRVSSPLSAPGGLRLVQALLNTVSPQVEELETPGSLSDWLSRNALLPAGTDPDTVGSRAHPRHAFGSARPAGHPQWRHARPGEGRFAQSRRGGSARPYSFRDRDGTSRFELISHDLDDALGILLGFVHVARAEGKWPAFKLCGHPGLPPGVLRFHQESQRQMVHPALRRQDQGQGQAAG